MIGPHVVFLVPLSQAGLVERLLLAYHVEAIREKGPEDVSVSQTSPETPLEPR